MKICISFTKTRNCIMFNKRAFIVWVGWQDGKLLFNFLKLKNYHIVWISRDKNIYYGIDWVCESTDILVKQQIDDLISAYTPDEIYYLAAYHHSSQDSIPDDWELLINSRKIHVDGYFNILQAIQKYSPHTKICYASSCLIYGGTDTNIQNESTLPSPNSIYSITKLEWMYLGNWYAEKYWLQVINAILYNHESEYRSPKFVSMKIIQWAINIKKGLQDNITLWDLSTQVDRWYAWDYIEAMRWLLQTDCQWDYIISSWILHTIQEMVEIVFNYLDLDWKKYIKVDTMVVKRKRWKLLWDNSKIKKDIWRESKTWFEEMLVKMMNYHIK